MKKGFLLVGLCSIVLFLSVCKKDTTTSTTSTTTTNTVSIPAPYQKIYGATDIYVDGSYIVIKTTGVPDHKSPYFQGTQWSSTKYEAYNGTNANWSQNPNKIASQNIVFKIPLTPTASSNPAATPLGPIGVSLNGVPFYNQYAGPNQPLTTEINSFDQYNGHPQQMGGYHYHVEPLYLTANKGDSALLGFLLDGYPVYGPVEHGVTITNSNLDAYHGHTSLTADYPSGIYHYHITSADPYINGSGFYGNAGTVTF